MTQNHLKIALFLAVALGGCGKKATLRDESGAPSAEAAAGPFAVAVDISYVYEAVPESHKDKVGGKSHWSCVASVTMSFSEPVSLATTYGNVGGSNQAPDKTFGSLSEMLVHASVREDFREIVLAPSRPGVYCNWVGGIRHLVVSHAVRSVSGRALGADLRQVLGYPPNGMTPGAATTEHAERTSTTSGVETAPCRGVAAHCITRVTPDALNRALRATDLWIEQEKLSPMYASDDFQGYVVEGTPLQDFQPLPSSPYNSGRPNLLYVLRRAAFFTKQLFPDLQAIPIARLSATGDDPMGGAHTDGHASDVFYITTGKGNEITGPNSPTGGPYDWERNFWFIFGLRMSWEVRQLFTAYGQEIVDYGRQAWMQGLISASVAGSMYNVWQDHGQNHDGHMHVGTLPLEKKYRFTRTDNRYICGVGAEANLYDPEIRIASTVAGNSCDPDMF